MDRKFETSKTFDGPAGNNYAELTIIREQEREDAIKRGLIDDPDRPKALEDARVFRGTCMDMCPLYEREQREFQNDVKRWEMNQSTGRIDKDLAVKAFHRPAAGNEQALPSDVRPPPVLTKTLDYLVDRIVSASDPLDKDTHGFVRDRTRSIRQDFTLQNERGSEAIACHERIVRFHILSLHQMCEVDGFDAHQEMEQLRKTLQSLAEYYDDQRETGMDFPHEAEFRAYHVLTRLRDPDVLRHIQTLPRHIRHDEAVRHALNLYKYAQRSNEEIGRFKPPNCEGSHNAYSTWFRLIRSHKTTYAMACLCETQFNDVRKGALKAMRKAFIAAVKAPSMDELIETLGCDDQQEVETQCEQYGIVVRPDETGIPRPILNKSSPFDETRPDMKQRFSERLVEFKRGSLTFADVINGATSGTANAMTSSSPARRKRANSTKVEPDQSIFAARPNEPIVNRQPEFSFNAGQDSSPATTNSFQFKVPSARVDLTNDPVNGQASSSSLNHIPKSEVTDVSVSTGPSKAAVEPKIDHKAIIREVSTEIVNRILQDEIQTVSAKTLLRKQESQRQDTELLNHLSTDLLNDLIRNQLDDAIMKAYISQWRQHRDKRNAWKRIRLASERVQTRRRKAREEAEAEARRLEEHRLAFEELRRPARGHIRKRARLSSPTYESTIHPATAENMAQAKQVAELFWRPIDLVDLFKSVAVPSGQKQWRLVIARPYEASKGWIEDKFNLVDKPSRTELLDDQSYMVDMIDGTETRPLTHVGALIFCCSDDDGYDRQALLSLLQRVAEESDWCFPLLIITPKHSDNHEALAQALMLPEVLADKKSPITSYHISTVATKQDVQDFETTFAQMLQNATSTKKSPLGMDRDAARAREERRKVAPPLSRVKRLQPRAKSSFCDWSVLDPVPPQRITLAPAPKDAVPPQLSSLLETIQHAKRLLASRPPTPI